MFCYTKHLKKHFNKYHGQESSEFLCNFCGSLHKFFDDYLTHLESHISSAEQQCHLCMKMFMDRRKFKNHMKGTHRKKKNLTEVCPFCGKNMKSLKIHIEDMHTDLKVINCDKCDYTNKKRLVTTHFEQVHKALAKPCPYCGKSVMNFKRHFKRNCSSSPTVKTPVISCEQCSKKFSTKYHLTRHVNSTHKNIRDIESKQCNYKTRLITESGIRPDRILHSDLAFKNFTNRSIQQWNDLPANIKNSSNYIYSSKN